MFDDLRMFSRFARGLGGFLRTPLSPEDCERIVQEDLENRERSFLEMLRRAVFEHQPSPYRKLFEWAGVSYRDAEVLVLKEGIEGALDTLYRKGIHISIEEFKGRRPVRRTGLELPVEAEDFDNPLLTREFEVNSGGSTGRRRRLAVDLDSLIHDSACIYFGYTALGIHDRPVALWLSVPPGSAGIKNALRQAKLGRPIERWFTPTQSRLQPGEWQSVVFLKQAVWASRFSPAELPPATHVPLDDAHEIVRWLAAKAAAGTPARLDTQPTGAVRVCIAAAESGVDISGSWFRVSGEPLTPSKAALIEQTGCHVTCGWGMSEASRIGLGCAHRKAVDEVHILSSRVAVVQQKKILDETEVGALYLTSLLPLAPKLMINVETGDSGVVPEGSCGCALERLGFRQRVHTIRSYEKLTTAGMHFMGSDLISLVEEALPDRFGGYPTDYQFMEQDDGPRSGVTLVVSPSVGEVRESDLIAFVLERLGERSRGERAMADHWRRGDIVSVERRRPYATPAAKIPPLQIFRG